MRDPKIEARGKVSPLTTVAGEFARLTNYEQPEESEATGDSDLRSVRELMKKVKALRPILSITVLSLVAVGIIVLALPVPAVADGATVINDFGCTLTAADAGLSAALHTTESHAVVTPSGNTQLTCHFDVPPAIAPSGTLHHEGFLCGTQGGFTRDSRSVTNKNEALLVCTIH